MNRRLLFTPTAQADLNALRDDVAAEGVYRQVRKALGYLELNPRHPGLHTHEYSSLVGAHGERVWEAYAQNNTPGAYRIFFHYGPDIVVDKRVVPTITIVAITPHP